MYAGANWREPAIHARVFVAPPLPAPYLAEVPTLTDDELAALDARRQPSPAKVAAARQTIERLRQLIRRARTRYEETASVLIMPERPAA